MDKRELTGLEKLVVLVLTPLASIWKGFVMCKLWLWFVVPLGLAPLTIPLAIGLMLLRALIIYAPDSKPEIENKDGLRLIILSCGVHPAVVLGLCAIVHLFI